MTASGGTDALRGRVMSLYGLVLLGSGPPSGLLSGWMAGQFGPRSILLLSGVSSLAAAGAFDDPDYFFEPWWPGIRALAWVEGGRLIRLRAAGMADALAFAAVRLDTAILDFLSRQMLSLPMSYFTSRRTGDIQRRLDGARQVREFAVHHGIGALLALAYPDRVARRRAPDEVEHFAEPIIVLIAGIAGKMRFQPRVHRHEGFHERPLVAQHPGWRQTVVIWLRMEGERR